MAHASSKHLPLKRHRPNRPPTTPIPARRAAAIGVLSTDTRCGIPRDVVAHVRSLRPAPAQGTAARRKFPTRIVPAEALTSAQRLPACRVLPHGRDGVSVSVCAVPMQMLQVSVQMWSDRPARCAPGPKRPRTRPLASKRRLPRRHSARAEWNRMDAASNTLRGATNTVQHTTCTIQLATYNVITIRRAIVRNTVHPTCCVGPATGPTQRCTMHNCSVRRAPTQAWRPHPHQRPCSTSRSPGRASPQIRTGTKHPSARTPTQCHADTRTSVHKRSGRSAQTGASAAVARMRRRPKRMGYHRRRPSLPCSRQPVFGVGLFHQLQRRRCVALRIAHMPLDRSGDGPRGNPTVKSAAAHHMGSVIISQQCLIGWLAYTCSSVNKNESSESTPSNLTESNRSAQVPMRHALQRELQGNASA